MTFRVGQKVVCVDVSPTAYGRAPVELALDGIYTIASIEEYADGAGLTFVEVKSPEEILHWAAFGAYRFRPVVERKTDISIFTAMLTDKKIGVEA